MYTFYKKSHFVYAEHKDYVLEIDFEMINFLVVEFSVRHKPTVLDWKKNARKIEEITFRKWLKIGKKYNPFLNIKL